MEEEAAAGAVDVGLALSNVITSCPTCEALIYDCQLLLTNFEDKHTATRYCPSNTPTSLPAKTTTSVSTNAASDSTKGNTPENLYFIMTLFGVFGGEGSALYVERRWSPRSGSMEIFSSQNMCGCCVAVSMIAVRVCTYTHCIQCAALSTEILECGMECSPGGISEPIKRVPKEGTRKGDAIFQFTGEHNSGSVNFNVHGSSLESVWGRCAIA